MKAKENKSNKVYNILIEEGDIILTHIETQEEVRRVSYNTFREKFTLIEDREVPTLGEEKLKAKILASQYVEKAKNKPKETPSINKEKKTRKRKTEDQPTDVTEKLRPPKKPSREPAPHNTSAITLKALCEELGISPADARKVLRKNKVDKPPSGSWTWEDPEEIEKVRKLLK